MKLSECILKCKRVLHQRVGGKPQKVVGVTFDTLDELAEQARQLENENIELKARVATLFKCWADD